MPKSSLTPAYVLWLGPTGLTFARALGRAGVPVVGLHHDRNEPSVGTRYARVKFLPRLDSDEQAWLDFLLSEARRLAPNKGVIIPASDSSWLFVARHREILSRGFHFAMPQDDDLAQWMGKPFQYAAAARAGVQFPRTFVPRGLVDVRRIANDAQFPCLLKPVHSHLWQREYGSKLAFVRNGDELIARSEHAVSRGLDLMIQEYIPATDDEIYGCFVCLDRTSRPLACCVSRKIRQNEPRFGNSCLSECVNEPRVVELGLKLAQEMGFHGVGSAEFKRDPRDGEFKLMEFNVRPTLLMAVAVDSGVNIPLITYRELCSEIAPQGMVTPARYGRRVGILAKDIHAARFYRERGELSRLAWLRSWRRARDTHFAWDDLAPFRGYLHGMIDHWRTGRFRTLPPSFPSAEEWNAGVWDGQPLQRVGDAPADDDHRHATSRPARVA